LHTLETILLLPINFISKTPSHYQANHSRPSIPTTSRKMAFFPRSFYNNSASSNDTSFTPLFRLLDDFDSYSRQSGSGHGRRLSVPSWQPKFDIRETGQAYELHGELPGMVKENVNIEFTDPQTMVVRGKTERTYTAGSSPGDQPQDIQDTSASENITEKSESTNERRNSHQATVEDEANASQTGWEDVSGKSDENQQIAKSATKLATADRAKYWLTERSIGEFSRSFSFPARIEQEGVSASLKDGILTVVVPKAKKHETRRVSIN